MGVYIKGMEMPTSCFKCGFHHHSVDDGYYDFEYCGANNAEFNNAYDSTKPHINPFEERLSSCPLVLVPPHGRLGDLDKLVEKIDGIWDCNDMVFKPDDHCCIVLEDCKGCKWAQTKDCIQRMVENAPAIIPAEEGE